MAVVYNKSGIWYARFRYRCKEYQRSTHIKVPTKGKAAIEDSKARAEEEMYRIIVETKGGESVEALFARLTDAIEKLPKTERKARRINLADRLRRGISAKMTLDEAWREWEKHPNRGSAGEQTVKMYQAYWGKPDSKSGFSNWAKKNHPEIKSLHEISRGIAEEYAAHLKSMQIAPRTYNGAIKFLASMFRTLSERAGLAENVWDGINRTPNVAEGRRNLTSEELETVCKKAQGDLRYLIALGLYTGLRLGDCVNLQWDGRKTSSGEQLGVRMDEGVIRIIPSKTSRKGKVVAIPIHPVLEAMLSEMNDDMAASGYLFPELAELYQANQSDKITSRIQKFFISCGIETKETLKGRHRSVVRVGFHSLRHSFVSLCAQNKVPQSAIQDLVGHGSPAMTALYTHANEQQRSDAIGSLPSITFSDVEPKAEIA